MFKARSIQYIKGIGPKKAELFANLGIFTDLDLLRYYPRNYEDWTKPVDICDTIENEMNVIKATVTSAVSEIRTKGGHYICKGVAEDETGLVTLTFFNNKFIPRMIHRDTSYFFKGKITRQMGGKEMLSPEFFTIEKSPKVVPIYRLCSGISSNQISQSVKNVLANITEIKDSLPESIRKKYKLCGLLEAIKKIHFPQAMGDIDIAKKRLIFEEFLVLQLGMRKIKKASKIYTAHQIKENYSKDFEKLLPFELTNAQKNAIEKCLLTMTGKEAMNVLLQGDVGSGKTAVAASLCHSCAKNFFQCAMMAPTEILATQHFHSLSELLRPVGIRVELLTGSLNPKRKKEVHEMVEKGEIDVLVGTHALISKSVKFKNLGFVITDEQHRFGVKQRAALAEKGTNPHTLVMSATPIPRTLALMIYGDLDLVVLDELPKGRQKIETYTINSQIRIRAFNYIKKHIEEGRQAYIICPLIEQGESERASIESYYEYLKGYFKEDEIAVLHGKMKNQDKDLVMESFAKNKKKILLATTVVEVGVDVPNAVIMLIENAEMYGLSQLHQLRGRVGRGQHKSTCILLTDAQNEESVTRMRLLCSSTDGFKIADADLKLRGPGDFFGKKQHGLPELKIADMASDIEILREAQLCCEEIENDLDNHPELLQEVRRLFQNSQNENEQVTL